MDREEGAWTGRRVCGPRLAAEFLLGEHTCVGYWILAPASPFPGAAASVTVQGPRAPLRPAGSVSTGEPALPSVQKPCRDLCRGQERGPGKARTCQHGQEKARLGSGKEEG